MSLGALLRSVWWRLRVLVNRGPRFAGGFYTSPTGNMGYGCGLGLLRGRLGEEEEYCLITALEFDLQAVSYAHVVKFSSIVKVKAEDLSAVRSSSLGAVYGASHIIVAAPKPEGQCEAASPGQYL